MSIHVFTDGGCTDNGGKNPKASYAYVVYRDGTELIRGSGLVVQGEYGDELPSNNRAEWTALLHALRYLELNGIQAATCYTDSKLIVSTATEWYDSWVAKSILRKKKNATLIGEVMSVYKRLNVVLKHCRSHQVKPSGVAEQFIWGGNDLCDKLCGELLQFSGRA